MHPDTIIQNDCLIKFAGYAGMGHVWLAQHTLLKRFVTIKTCTRSLHETKAFAPALNMRIRPLLVFTNDHCFGQELTNLGMSNWKDVRASKMSKIPLKNMLISK